MSGASIDDLPRVVLAGLPLALLATIVGVLSVTSPFATLTALDDGSTVEVLAGLTVIGTLAGIGPVAIGMLWFPVIRDLDPRYLHGFLALAAGVLVFIGLEMLADVVGYGVETERTSLAVVLAVAGIGGTFALMHAASEWRHREMASREKTGLEIAYLVALALGLHSVGEGLGIGVAYVQGDATLVTLLVLGFVLHNVMEGPTVVAAVARDAEAPPLRHFAAMGVIAGGPVILGGWIGSVANSPLLVVLFYAIAVGAIGQVLIEVGELIHFDAEGILTRTNTLTFLTGFLLMFVLEDVLIDLLLEGGLAAG